MSRWQITLSEPMQNALYVLRRWGPHSSDAVAGLSGDQRVTVSTLRALARRECVEFVPTDLDDADRRWRLTQRGKLAARTVRTLKSPLRRQRPSSERR